MSNRTPLQQRLIDELRLQEINVHAESERHSHFPAGDHVGGTRAAFLRPTIEETRTWGNSLPLNFQGVHDVPVSLQSPQLVHILRRHPTTFTVLAVCQFVTGFVGELGSAWSVVISYVCGVGQAQVTVQRTLDFSDADNGQVSSIVTLPAHAMQGVITLVGTPGFDGPKGVLLTMLAAPVFS